MNLEPTPEDVYAALWHATPVGVSYPSADGDYPFVCDGRIHWIRGPSWQAWIGRTGKRYGPDLETIVRRYQERFVGENI